MIGGSALCCIWIIQRISLAVTYENLALYKRTWQSSPYSDVRFGADLAVDGRASDLSLWGGECVVSNYSHVTAEWRVDLGEVLNIHHIVLLYATNNEAWGKNNYFATFFLGFSVYISNTTNKEDGVLCFRDTVYTISTIPNPATITCITQGRYVIYYNNRSHKAYPKDYSMFAYNDLCEVQVYGCNCGHAGRDSSKLCVLQCSNDNVTSDHITGNRLQTPPMQTVKPNDKKPGDSIMHGAQASWIIVVAKFLGIAIVVVTMVVIGFTIRRMGQKATTE